MGGWTVLYYLLKYPPTDATIEVAASADMPDQEPPSDGKGYLDRERRRDDEKSRVQVAGAFVLCPMVEGMSTKGDSLLMTSLKAVAPFCCGRVHWESTQILCG
jgi:hypothetical protein